MYTHPGHRYQDNHSLHVCGKLWVFVICLTQLRCRDLCSFTWQKITKSGKFVIVRNLGRRPFIEQRPCLIFRTKHYITRIALQIRHRQTEYPGNALAQSRHVIADTKQIATRRHRMVTPRHCSVYSCFAFLVNLFV